MPKKIVILMDGTSNQISADRSNILRLYGTLKKNDAQLVFYDPGVGTMAAESSWLGLWRKASEVFGMATGKGLDENVKEAYRFIVDNFCYEKSRKGKPGWQDEIYIVGFSRGAYSARVLAGFLRAFGVMEHRNLNLLSYVYRAYKRIGSKADAGEGSKAWDEINLYTRTLRPYAPSIRFLGLFDTVSSVIVSGRYLPRFESHAFTNNNSSIEAVRHAVAIHEKRVMFRPCLWPEGQDYRPNRYNRHKTTPQNQREVWFTGVHTDVGGGEAEAESGLAKIPLAWFIAQARQEDIGLLFNTTLVNRLVLGKKVAGQKTYRAPNPRADKHYMAVPWMLLEFFPAFRPKASKRPRLWGWTIPLFERRVLPEGARIHASVFARAAAKNDLPPNLPSDYRIEP